MKYSARGRAHFRAAKRVGLGAAVALVWLLITSPRASIYAQVTPTPTIRGQGAGSIAYPAGWNLLASPGGSAYDAVGSVYTWQRDDTMYESLPSDAPLRPGVGYWAYFSEPSSIIALPVAVAEQPFPLTAPPAEWIMIGNPLPALARVIGADAVLTYDPTTGQYQQATTLAVGQGGWVYFSTGGTVTLDPLPHGQ